MTIIKYRSLLVVLATFIVPLAIFAQKKKKLPISDTATKAVPVVIVPSPKPGAPRPFSEIIPDTALVCKGAINVYKTADKWFFELPDSLLGRDMLIVSRIIKGAADTRFVSEGYAGDQINEGIIRFEKGINGKLFIRSISYSVMSKDSSRPMFQSVMNSNVQPIAATFDIKALSKDSTGVLIDMTEFINGDNELFSFSGQYKGNLRLTNLHPDKSYIVTVKTYPLNIEIKTVKTYTKQPSMPGQATGNATFELNTSILLLPQKPMQPRCADNRVGYFTAKYTDFDAAPQGIKEINMITRWRLEPKPEDIEKYKRGELVEPAKPIIYYIDPATPKKWVPYLIKGVNDWQKAFEKAGFKNAIIGKPPPTKEEDSTWSLEDARYSAIVYKPSNIPNASGPNVHDPRSGEIIESHINWYHNIMLLLRNWYFIQASAVDSQARKLTFDDELMGELIRFVSSHEVGHTLGLRHNFGASSTIPVDSLRNKKWVEANGHTPSIMDYARFNYVAQPEDKISRQGLFPGIGEYDNWAIEWGYKILFEKDEEKEKAMLSDIITKRLSANKKLRFGTETDQFDPRNQNEDLGDNAMKAGAYGIKNLKRIVPYLIRWTNVPNEDYTELAAMYKEVVNQFGLYMGHVAKNIGGVKTTPKTHEENGPVIEYVSKTTQKEAMRFLSEQLFATPSWLIDKEISKKISYSSLNTILAQQEGVMYRLLDFSTMINLLEFESAEGKKAYTVNEMLTDLRRSIFSELYSDQSISIYRRNLQKAYLEKLMGLVPPVGGAQRAAMPGMLSVDIKSSDISSIIKQQLVVSVDEIKRKLISSKDAMTKIHLQDLQRRLNTFLNP